MPIPGANPIGYLETKPITIQAMPEASAVEKNTAEGFIPPSASMVGFTPRTLARDRNVVIPAINSVLSLYYSHPN